MNTCLGGGAGVLVGVTLGKPVPVGTNATVGVLCPVVLGFEVGTGPAGLIMPRIYVVARSHRQEMRELVSGFRYSPIPNRSTKAHKIRTVLIDMRGSLPCNYYQFL